MFWQEEEYVEVKPKISKPEREKRKYTRKAKKPEDQVPVKDKRWI